MGSEQTAGSSDVKTSRKCERVTLTSLTTLVEQMTSMDVRRMTSTGVERMTSTGVKRMTTLRSKSSGSEGFGEAFDVKTPSVDADGRHDGDGGRLSV